MFEGMFDKKDNYDFNSLLNLLEKKDKRLNSRYEKGLFISNIFDSNGYDPIFMREIFDIMIKRLEGTIFSSGLFNPYVFERLLTTHEYDRCIKTFLRSPVQDNKLKALNEQSHIFAGNYKDLTKITKFMIDKMISEYVIYFNSLKN